MSVEALPYLKISDLTVGYKRKPSDHILFSDLNLTLSGGKLVCFMGPNGVGKSTLIRTLAGLQKPLSGSIKISDSDQKYKAKQISVVLTDKISSGNMTAGELITLGRYPYLEWHVKLSDHDKFIIDDAINKVHIENLIHKQLSELSDGQLQMVMIARALAQDTPIIILDEPTAHLDLNNRVEIMRLLYKISHEMNKAILVATHELDLALQTADIIWLTGKEKNILTGIPEDLVLDGTFDNIFEFKGFNLKTGKIHQEAFRNISVHLQGEGHLYLWTKNALQRSGFRILAKDALQENINVMVELNNEKPHWVLNKDNRLYKFDTIASLIEVL